MIIIADFLKIGYFELDGFTKLGPYLDSFASPVKTRKDFFFSIFFGNCPIIGYASLG